MRLLGFSAAVLAASVVLISSCAADSSDQEIARAVAADVEALLVASDGEAAAAIIQSSEVDYSAEARAVLTRLQELLHSEFLDNPPSVTVGDAVSPGLFPISIGRSGGFDGAEDPFGGVTIGSSILLCVRIARFVEIGPLGGCLDPPSE